MTIAYIPSIVSYVTSGVGPYSIPFEYSSPADLRVSIVDLNWVTTSPAFSVVNNAVTLSAVPPSGTIIIYRDTPINQQLRLQDLAVFPALAVEDTLDRQSFIDQELARGIGASVRLPIGESAPVLPSAANRANAVLGFNELGAPILVGEAPSGMVSQSINAYPTATLASAANLPAGSTGIMTLGKSAINDGGAARYEITDSVHANERGVLDVTVNGVAKKARLMERVLRPEMFGVSAASADNRQGFLDMQKEIQYRGGGRVEFLENKVYNVYAGSDSLTGTTKTVMSLTGLKGFKWYQNGSKILAPRDMEAETWALRVLNLTDIEDFDIDAIAEATVNSPSGGFIYGLMGVYMQGACRNGRMNLRQIGGRSGNEIVPKAGMTWDQRAREIDINVISQNVFYPVACERNGHECDIRVNAIDGGRSLFLISVSNINFDVMSTNSGAYQDLVISAACYPEEWKSTVRNIKGTYTCKPTSAEPPLSAAIGLVFQQYAGGTDKGYIDNVHIVADIDCKSADGSIHATTQPIYAACQGLAGALETVDRGHTLTNVTFSLKVKNMNDGSGKYFADFFEDGKAGLGATSSVRNITFEDIDAGPENVSIGFRIAASVVDSGLVFRNINAPTTALIMDTPQKGALDASQSVKFSNFFSSFDNWTSGSVNQGYERLPNGRIRHFGRLSLVAGNTTPTGPVPAPWTTDIALPIPFRALNSGGGVFDCGVSVSEGSIFTGVESDLAVWLQALGNLRIERNTTSASAMRVQWFIEGHI
jgi:hypothetical protein